MDGYKPSMSFDSEAVAAFEDIQRGDEAETVVFLTEKAGKGSALELGIGTGRIALPLAARGIRVEGIDFSEAMVARLRTKPGGKELKVTLGNFADVPTTGEFQLIYLIFNTLFNLLTQDEQVRCFQNVAKHLSKGGVFVIEAYTPTFLYNLRNHNYVETEALATHEVRLDLGRHDPVNQRLDESHVVLSPKGVQLFPIVQRYSWPHELDLMARIAHLKLKERWGGWKKEPFTASSDRHISVYSHV